MGYLGRKLRQKVREKDAAIGILPGGRVRPLSLRFTLQLRRPASLSRIAVFSVAGKTSAAGGHLAGFFFPG